MSHICTSNAQIITFISIIFIRVHFQYYIKRQIKKLQYYLQQEALSSQCCSETRVIMLTYGVIHVQVIANESSLCIFSLQSITVLHKELFTYIKSYSANQNPQLVHLSVTFCLFHFYANTNTNYRIGHKSTWSRLNHGVSGCLWSSL